MNSLLVPFFRESRLFLNTETKKIHKTLLDGSRKYSIDENSLAAYLYLGYVPGAGTLFKNEICIPGGSFVEVNDDDIIISMKEQNFTEYFGDFERINSSKEELKKILITEIEKKFQANRVNVVPLSGGMDSRIILAALNEITSLSNIHTYTFGVPGSYDYDIPNQIARHFGTQHKNFDAKDTIFTLETLSRAALVTDANTEIFHPVVLNQVKDYYGNNTIFWSGFAGDLVGGGFQYAPETSDSIDSLLKYEKQGIHYYNDADSEIAKSIIVKGTKMKGVIPHKEACFWENHVERYTAHHIFRNDMEFIAPLVEGSFLHYFFNLKNSQRENKNFFNQSLSEVFQEFFVFPTKDYGYKYAKNPKGPLMYKFKDISKKISYKFFPNRVVHPNIAYIDMKKEINYKKDLSETITFLLNDLCKRDIVENNKVLSMLKAHRVEQQDFTKDLINLASLEVFLKVAKI